MVSTYGKLVEELLQYGVGVFKLEATGALTKLV